MAIRFLTLTSVVALVVLTETAALAQTPPADRPYRGLFGGGVGDTGESLTLTGGTGVSYDSGIWVGGQSATTAGAAEGTGGAFGSGSARLDYSLTRARVTFGASANGGLSYYPVLKDPLVASRSGALGLSFMPSRSTQVAASESVAYQPFYNLASFPGLDAQPSAGPILSNDSQSALLENHVTSASNVSLSQKLSRRAALLLAYEDYRSRSASGALDVATQTESGHLTYSVAKGLGVRAGYGYMGGSYGASENSSGARAHLIDAGLDFNRALSLSRRVTLSFATGSSAFRYQNQTRYFLTGSAHLTREIGRSWNASLAFSRAANIENTFRQPVISDALSASFGGLINRRLQFQSGAGVALGNVGFAASANGFRAYQGTASLRIGMTRHLALGLVYGYSQYDFDSVVYLPAGLPRQTGRQSVHVNLDVWVPLIQRTRRSNVAR